MRIAMVHDWLTGLRGGEKVLSLVARSLPDADLFTLLHTPGSTDRFIESRRIVTSPLNRLPRVERYYRYLLPLMPLAAQRLDVRDYDLVLSFSHCVAKGVRRSERSVHVCYCFTPMRYVWDQCGAYRQSMGASGAALKIFGGLLRRWDRRSADNVDLFLANSRNVAGRIERIYNRQSEVVYSPIDTEFLTPDGGAREDFYLMVTALAPYKRADQAIEAFRQLGLPLRIIGSGQQYDRLRRSAPPNVTLLGWQGDESVREHYRRCRALIFPGEEDFGMVPLEAMACGAPVIAYAAGGAVETVIDVDRPPSQASPAAGDRPVHGPTGLLYTPQTADGLAAAVRRFEQVADRFVPSAMSAWARNFGPDRFYREFTDAVNAALRNKGVTSGFDLGKGLCSRAAAN